MTEPGVAAISSAGPSATTWPPCSPAPGPMSTSQSAARIICSSCSTTSTVLPSVAQPLERRDQTVVVALVQADRRLVEDVEDADELRADLGREPQPLRLAARERLRGAVELEIADADVARNVSRSRISFTIRCPISCSVAVRSSSSRNASARVTDMLRELVDRAARRP